MKNLPIGTQSFSLLQEKNNLYVDKTQMIYDLTHTNRIYFLSRPRRFGKSLLCSTLKAYFSGQKELFKGLKIEELEKEWKCFPILYIDFNGQKYETAKDLETQLDNQLTDWEIIYCGGQTIRNKIDFSGRFKFVIEQAHKQTGKRVVVIVDEYDKPLLEIMHKPHEYERSKALYKGFFGNLKAQDEHLEFVFITGVTKFAKVSIFSDLNQLMDISLEKDFETLCGFTKEELKTYFADRIEDMAKNRNMSNDECIALLKKHYDGYHFSDKMTDIFNPFSILNALRFNTIRHYWYSTATPTFIIRLLTAKDTVVDFKTLSHGQLPTQRTDGLSTGKQKHNPTALSDWLLDTT